LSQLTQSSCAALARTSGDGSLSCFMKVSTVSADAMEIAKTNKINRPAHRPAPARMLIPDITGALLT
jgi:hypothetical protein